MNDDRIEKLLRKGLPVRTPEGLIDTLKQDIRLPRAEARPEVAVATPWFKRWMPALSFAAVMVGCLAAIAVQTSVISDLRKQNEALQAANGNLDGLQKENAELKRLKLQSQELDRLRKDNAELQTLRAEAAQLASATQQIQSLRADNQKLQAAINAKVTAATGVDPNALAEAKAKAQRIQCVNNMKQILLAMRLWAEDNNDTFPPDFISMANQLNTDLILYCPSDPSHSPKPESRVNKSKAEIWAEVAAGNVSYTYVTPGIKETEDPRTVVLECSAHHNVIGLLDGSVQQLSDEGMRNHLKTVNGRTIFD